MENTPAASDIRPARLPAEAYARNFCDAHPPLSPVQAQIEADRCYYCYDAPCINACPTGINIPSFIRRIAEGNLRGAAHAILSANPLGGMCARVCPTEVLCEEACVRNTNEEKPVEIGLLQRFATDAHFAAPGAPLFTRAADTGRRVAVVGAGPAGLACAHRLALHGHAVTLFDARPKLGGLNEYGLASYKTTDGFAQREVAWLLSVGGITVRTGVRLGTDVSLEGLVGEYDAVFLGLGLGGVNALGIAEPQAEGLRAAVDFIAELRQAASPADVPVGRRVVVIGGGMTAVDAAVQAKKLGAEEVSIVYRRGEADMPASAYEQDWARSNGVRIIHWAAPHEIVVEDGRVRAATFACMHMVDGRLAPRGDFFTLPADMVLKAIGQTLIGDAVAGALTLRDGRIATDEDGATGHPRVWAGGDCRHGGRDLTVEAVEHGKRSAEAIHRALAA